jgi:hypothetical protein
LQAERSVTGALSLVSNLRGYRRFRPAQPSYYISASRALRILLNSKAAMIYEELDLWSGALLLLLDSSIGGG